MCIHAAVSSTASFLGSVDYPKFWLTNTQLSQTRPTMYYAVPMRRILSEFCLKVLFYTNSSKSSSKLNKTHIIASW